MSVLSKLRTISTAVFFPIHLLFLPITNRIFQDASGESMFTSAYEYENKHLRVAVDAAKSLGHEKIISAVSHTDELQDIYNVRMPAKSLMELAKGSGRVDQKKPNTNQLTSFTVMHFFDILSDSKLASDFRVQGALSSGGSGIAEARRAGQFITSAYSMEGAYTDWRAFQVGSAWDSRRRSFTDNLSNLVRITAKRAVFIYNDNILGFNTNPVHNLPPKAKLSLMPHYTIYNTNNPLDESQMGFVGAIGKFSRGFRKYIFTEIFTDVNTTPRGFLQRGGASGSDTQGSDGILIYGTNTRFASVAEEFRIFCENEITNYKNDKNVTKPFFLKDFRQNGALKDPIDIRGDKNGRTYRDKIYAGKNGLNLDNMMNHFKNHVEDLKTKGKNADHGLSAWSEQIIEVMIRDGYFNDVRAKIEDAKEFVQNDKARLARRLGREVTDMRGNFDTIETDGLYNNKGGYNISITDRIGGYFQDLGFNALDSIVTFAKSNFSIKLKDYLGITQSDLTTESLGEKYSSTAMIFPNQFLRDMVVKKAYGAMNREVLSSEIDKGKFAVLGETLKVVGRDGKAVPQVFTELLNSHDRSSVLRTAIDSLDLKLGFTNEVKNRYEDLKNIICKTDNSDRYVVNSYQQFLDAIEEESKKIKISDEELLEYRKIYTDITNKVYQSALERGEVANEQQFFNSSTEHLKKIFYNYYLDNILDLEGSEKENMVASGGVKKQSDDFGAGIIDLIVKNNPSDFKEFRTAVNKNISQLSANEKVQKNFYEAFENAGLELSSLVNLQKRKEEGTLVSTKPERRGFKSPILGTTVLGYHLPKASSVLVNTYLLLATTLPRDIVKTAIEVPLTYFATALNTLTVSASEAFAAAAIKNEERDPYSLAKSIPGPLQKYFFSPEYVDRINNPKKVPFSPEMVVHNVGVNDFPTPLNDIIESKPGQLVAAGVNYCLPSSLEIQRIEMGEYGDAARKRVLNMNQARDGYISGWFSSLNPEGSDQGPTILGVPVDQASLARTFIAETVDALGDGTVKAADSLKVIPMRYDSTGKAFPVEGAKPGSTVPFKGEKKSPLKRFTDIITSPVVPLKAVARFIFGDRSKIDEHLDNEIVGDATKYQPAEIKSEVTNFATEWVKAKTQKKPTIPNIAPSTPSSTPATSKPAKQKKPGETKLPGGGTIQRSNGGGNERQNNFRPKPAKPSTPAAPKSEPNNGRGDSGFNYDNNFRIDSLLKPESSLAVAAIHGDHTPRRINVLDGKGNPVPRVEELIRQQAASGKLIAIHNV